MPIQFLLLFAFSSFCIPSIKGDIVFLQQPPNETQMIPVNSKGFIPCVVDSSVTKCNWYLNNKLYTPDRKVKFEGNLTEGNCSLTIIRADIAKMNGTCFCEVFTNDGNSVTSTKGEIYVTKKPVSVEIKLINSGKEISTPYLLVPPNVNEVEILIKSSGGAPPETENLIVTIDDKPLNVEYNINYEARIITSKEPIRVPTNSTVFVKHQHSLALSSPPSSILVATSQPKLYGDRVAIPKENDFSLALRGVRLSDVSGSKIVFQVTNETGENVNSGNKIPQEMVIGSKTYNVTLKQDSIFGSITYSVPLEIFRYDAMRKVEITSPGDVTLTPENKTATLECKADGEPQPEIHWLRFTGQSIDIYGKGSPITVSETGIYKCAALQKILEQERLKEAITVVNVQ